MSLRIIYLCMLCKRIGYLKKTMQLYGTLCTILYVSRKVVVRINILRRSSTVYILAGTMVKPLLLQNLGRAYESARYSTTVRLV